MYMPAKGSKTSHAADKCLTFHGVTKLVVSICKQLTKQDFCVGHGGRLFGVNPKI